MSTNTSSQEIDKLIFQIRDAEEAATVTNSMVAEVLQHLNDARSIHDSDISAADNAITVIDNQIATLEQDLYTETETRNTALATIRSDIDDLRREDNRLDDAITDEIEARQGADTALRSDIDDLSREVTALSDAIVDEAEERLQQDAELQSSLNTQEQRIENLEQRIDDDEQRIAELDRQVEALGEVAESPEWLRVIVDADGHVLAGIRADGSSWFASTRYANEIEALRQQLASEKVALDTAVADIDDLDRQVEALGEVTESPEWLRVIVDADGHVLAGIRADGSSYVYSDGANEEDIPADVAALAADLGRLEDRQEELADAIAAVGRVENNPEYVRAVLDSSGQIVAGIRRGVGGGGDIAEVNIPVQLTDDVRVSAKGARTILEAMEAAGASFRQVVDHSDELAPELPEPSMPARLNIVCSALPVHDEDQYTGFLEYYDMGGNYFRKPIEALGVQGQTSRYYARTGNKANYGFDFADGSKVKFGSWVPQDSFHLKASTKDATFCTLYPSYKHFETIIRALDARPNRVLRAASSAINAATGDKATDYPDGALCHPDGFPVELYHNGEYVGLYLLGLKKNRANYSMTKKDYRTVLMDVDSIMPSNYRNGFWSGDIWWEAFELKNPDKKTLRCGFWIKAMVAALPGTTQGYDTGTRIAVGANMDSCHIYIARDSGSGAVWVRETKKKVPIGACTPDQQITSGCAYYYEGAYDADYPLELLGVDGPLYDSSDKNKKNTAITKGVITSFPSSYQNVLDMTYTQASDGPYKKVNGCYVDVSADDPDGTVRYRRIDAEGDAEAFGAAREAFDAAFDRCSLLALLIGNTTLGNGDSIMKNTLWGTYGASLIAAFPYDLDGSYGTIWVGDHCNGTDTNTFNYYTRRATNWPVSLMYFLFRAETEAAYAHLRATGTLSVDAFNTIIDTWSARIGAEAYLRNLEAWPETPSYRHNYTNSAYWRQTSSSSGAAVWGAGIAYAIGDVVAIPMDPTGVVSASTRQCYECVRPHTSSMAKGDDGNYLVYPVTRLYERFPVVGGFYDSPERIKRWYAAQLTAIDARMGYVERAPYTTVEMEVTYEDDTTEVFNVMVQQ